MAEIKRANVTLTQVAAAAGVGLATASYALRNSPKIPAATTARIVAMARRMGYRPNPRIVALMAHVRRARPVPTGEVIAFVWINSDTRSRGASSPWVSGARARAEQLGFILEEFSINGKELTAERLAGVLRARGIVGTVLSPLLDRTRFAIDWNWRQFAPAIIGNAECTPELHHAGHHHFAGMRMAVLKVCERGCSKIAALIDANINERARRAWSASFLEHHPAPSRARRNLLAVSDSESIGRAARWLAKIRPEALITTMPMLARLRRSGVRLPDEAQVVVLDWTPNNYGYGGVDQCEEIIAANAVDLVIGQLNRNERGIPSHVKMLLFPGIWREGGSAVSPLDPTDAPSD